MSPSQQRILTTHVGSLPRGAEVVDLLFRREEGAEFSAAKFDEVMSSAVCEVVKRQTTTGISIVSDGETAKIGYATYIKDRLSGFGGDSPRQVALDLKRSSGNRASDPSSSPVTTI
jgi:5-methyltetrahydropteroyltriglutamate--homocysteine methyltransferase